MRVPREVWWLAGLTVFSLVIVLLLKGGPQEAAEKGIQVRTTYSGSPQGLLALYLTLQELGYDVRRLRSPLTRDTLPERGTLVVVDPLIPPADAEWRALNDWVAEGNSLILAGESAVPDARPVAAGAGGMFGEARVSYPRAVQPAYLARGVRRLAIRSYARISPLPEPQAKTEKPTREGEAWPTRKEEASPEIDRQLLLAAPVFADREGTVAAYARVGTGRVTLSCDSWSLCNEGIALDDNLVFALNAVGGKKAGPVYFDEYHHGYSRNLLWHLLPPVMKLGLALAALGLLMLLYARGRRFGRVIPLDRGVRQRTEFLGTMTALLRRGRAAKLALRTAHQAALQRLAAELGAPADSDPEALTRAASLVSEDAGAKLAAAFRQCEAALADPRQLTEAHAAALVRQLDEAIESVRRI